MVLGARDALPAKRKVSSTEVNTADPDYQQPELGELCLTYVVFDILFLEPTGVSCSPALCLFYRCREQFSQIVCLTDLTRSQDVTRALPVHLAWSVPLPDRQGDAHFMPGTELSLGAVLH